MRKVAVFTGSRAEYGLLSGLIYAIQHNINLQLQLLVSGAHLSPEFGETWQQIVADGFTIDAKIEMLLSSDSSIGTAKSMALGLIGVAEALTNLKSDIIVILGDRFEALAAAQSAMILRIPILHIHGGELTQGAYDDTIRHAITKMSSMHCTATEVYRQRVIQLGESPSNVINTGAIGLDYIQQNMLLGIPELSQALAFKLAKPFFLLTYHPVTWGGRGKSVAPLQAIFKAMDHFPNHQIIITYPNADDNGRKIIKVIQEYSAQQRGRILAVASLGQLLYLSALKHAEAVIGNSSSGIIEAPSLGTPTINIGERQKGRVAACSVINCGTTYEEIYQAIIYVLNEYSTKASNLSIVNPYDQGPVIPKIIDILQTMSLDSGKLFFDLITGKDTKPDEQDQLLVV